MFNDTYAVAVDGNGVRLQGWFCFVLIPRGHMTLPRLVHFYKRTGDESSNVPIP